MGTLYSEQRTWLHSVPAAVKLLLLALAGILLLFAYNPLVLGLGTGVCFLLFLSLGRARHLAHDALVAMLFAVVLIAGFHVYLGQPWVGVLGACRLFCASLMGLALSLSTRSDELLEVFERLLRPGQRLGLNTERVALMLAMMLRFAEHFFAVWKRLDDAHRVRTGRPGGVRILAPLIIHMLLLARRVADALEMRLNPKQIGN